MQTKRRHAFFSILLSTVFLFTACKTDSLETLSTDRPEDRPPELILPVPLPEPPPVLPSPIAPEGIYDLSDTDISNVHTDKKLIALTFDDAPKNTLENILAAFAAYNEANPDCPAFATVFCNGILFDNHTRHILSIAHAMGFELGNHGYSHADLSLLDTQTLTDEMTKTDNLLQTVDGKTTHLFRAPFGRVTAEVKTLARAPIIDWTIDTLDWTGVNEDGIYDCVFSQKFSGAIALMHDGYLPTVYAIKRLLPALKAAGYQAVTVSQMAKAHGCSLKIGGVYIRARKQT